MGALFDNGEYVLLTKIKIKLHHHWLWQMTSSSYPTKGTRHVTLVKTQIVSHEWGKNGNDILTKRTYPWWLWHRFSAMINQVMVTSGNL